MTDRHKLVFLRINKFKLRLSVNVMEHNSWEGAPIQYFRKVRLFYEDLAAFLSAGAGQDCMLASHIPNLFVNSKALCICADQTIFIIIGREKACKVRHGSIPMKGALDRSYTPAIFLHFPPKIYSWGWCHECR